MPFFGYTRNEMYKKRNVDRALNVNSRYYKANEFTVFLEVS